MSGEALRPEGSAPAHVLPLIVLAQFAGTSVWFVGNAVLGDLAHLWPHVESPVGWMTSSVQLGFIVGTLIVAFAGWSDRFAGHHVFFVSATGAAVTNLASLAQPESFLWFITTRFATGVCLAGVYPVGMKLAASWFREGLGAAIGFLVGALVLGTAFPHLLKTVALDASTLIATASGIALLGGFAILIAVPEGPGVARASRTRFRDAMGVFSDPGFRSAALGYFGHMWELYALWAFVPFAVGLALAAPTPASVSLGSFAVIAVGSLGCIAGGFASRRIGSARVAGVQLAGSGACALLSPAVFLFAPHGLRLAFLLVWGVLVVGDSPQFSAVAARCAPPDRVGTGLTIMNAIGFAITIPSIQLLTWLQPHVADAWLLWALLPGPVVGVISLRRVLRADPTRPSA
ncbi:MAG: MFS transporter [Myxococcota bacterium]